MKYKCNFCLEQNDNDKMAYEIIIKRSGGFDIAYCLVCKHCKSIKKLGYKHEDIIPPNLKRTFDCVLTSA